MYLYFQTDNACRIIQCPSGQILSHEYKCIYPGNTWIVDSVYLYITLSSGRNFSISPLLDSVRNLKSPWPQSWVIDYIAYATSEVDKQTQLMTVLQRMNFNSPFNPRPFFANTRDFLDRPWYLTSPNHETVKLESKISKHKSRSTELEDNSLPPLKGIYKNVDMKKATNIITELYFCDHVTLTPSDFAMKTNVYEKILNKITNMTLFDGEFTIVYNENGMHVEVCLSKSGFFRPSANNSTPCLLRVSLLCLVIMILIQTFQITINTVF